jgi:hypothetical protein
MPRACIFCGGTPVTEEHVWPYWLNDELPALEETTFTLERVGKETRVWRGKPASATVAVVCKSCNNGWMSDLESASAPLLIPLIRGRTPHLDPQAQRAISGWAFKTAVMLDQLNPTMAFRGEHLDHLRAHLEPHPTVHVFAAACDAKRPEDTFFRSTTVDLHLEPESGLPREAYVATLAVRHPAFQVIGSGIPDARWDHSGALASSVRRFYLLLGPFHLAARTCLDTRRPDGTRRPLAYSLALAV